MVPDELLGRDALLLGRHDVEREHRQHRAVHRHRDAHLVERDAVEELAHVVDRVDRHARHAHVAGDARVVAVVAAVGGQVEGHRQPLLPGREVAPVEGVGLLGRGEPGVLPDRPRLVDVHRRVGAAQVRRDTREGPQEVQALGVGGGVDRRHDDPLRGVPRQLVRGPAGLLLHPGGPLRRRVGGDGQLAQLGVGEGGDAAAHAGTPSPSRVRSSRSTASHPVKRNASMPACRYAASPSPGAPARASQVAPAAFRAAATSVACSAYCRSLPHRHAAVAPLARNASATSCGEPPSPCSTSIPPAQNRLAAKPARAACVRSGPRLARKTAARCPWTARTSPTGRRATRRRRPSAAAAAPRVSRARVGPACAATASRRAGELADAGDRVLPVGDPVRPGRRRRREPPATSPEDSAAASPPSRSIRLEPRPRGARPGPR